VVCCGVFHIKQTMQRNIIIVLFVFTTTLVLLLQAKEEQVRAEDKHPSIKEVTPDNIQQTIQQGNVLIEFYAPWCGHCNGKSVIVVYHLEVMIDN
jgi:thiol:disulfide interchange protein